MNHCSYVVQICAAPVKGILPLFRQNNDLQPYWLGTNRALKTCTPPLLQELKSATKVKLIPTPALLRQRLAIAAALGGIRVEGKSREAR